jgi:aryl-alcohol dehydrogenase-like predicted oxidoreductase
METRRLGRTGQMVSLLTFGGFALHRISPKEADTVLEMALEAGITNIDVAPSYGEAEEHIGSWFKRHGKKFFLGCKTEERLKEDAWESIKRSLERLHVDHFDLFQLHGVSDMGTLDTALGPGGALEAIIEAREQGLVRFIGITGHNPPVQNEALKRFDFDTVMFPLNRVHAAHFNEWNDWRPLLKTARQKDAGVFTIKAVAKQAWEDRSLAFKKTNTWYEPYTEVAEIEKSLWYTLSQDVTSAPLTSEWKLWPVIIDAANRFKPLSKKKQAEYVTSAAQYEPLAGPQMD